MINAIDSKALLLDLSRMKRKEGNELIINQQKFEILFDFLRSFCYIEILHCKI